MPAVRIQLTLIAVVLVSAMLSAFGNPLSPVKRAAPARFAVTSIVSSFEAAVDACGDMGKILATADTQEDFDELVSAVKSWGIKTSARYYIGLHFDEEAQDFLWPDGTSSTANFSKWKYNPKKYGQKGWGCGLFNYDRVDNKFSWAPQSCNIDLPAICQKADKK